MIRIWVSVPRHHDFWVKLIDTIYSGFEIVDLKPEQHSIAIRFNGLIPNETMVMLNVKPVQLEDKLITEP